MSVLTEELRAEIRSNPILAASLHHRSARHDAAKYHSETATPGEMYDAWETLGKSVISLFATRLALNNPDCRTPATATRARTAINGYILADLHHAIADIAIVGPGVRSTGTELDRTRDTIARQLIGAIALVQGYDTAVKKVLSKVLFNNEISIPMGKDEKTILQEYLQSRRIPLPMYEIQSTSGVGHKQLFEVKVIANGRMALGHGTSRRLAEQDAAANFLATYLPTAKESRKFSFQSEISIRSLAKSMPALNNLSQIKSLAERLERDSWDANLFALAFAHSSADLRLTVKPFGKDNKLLAFVGSEVIQWAAKDAIIQGLNTDEIRFAGGVATIAPLLISAPILGEIFEKICPPKVLMLGKGEGALKTPTKVEFAQAYIGALFLSSNKPVNHSTDLFSLCPGFGPHFGSGIGKFALAREKLLSPKTLLQERCQANILSIVYQTRSKQTGNKISLQPTIQLASPWLAESLEFVGGSESTVLNMSRKKTDIEEDLAQYAIGVFDTVIGDSNLMASANFRPLNYAQVWLLRHTFEAVRSFYSEGNKHGNVIPIIPKYFATMYAASGDYPAFCNWLNLAAATLGAFKSNDVNVLLDFYAWVGKDKNFQIRSGRLLETLTDIEVVLRSLDALTSQDVRKSTGFKTLVQEASIYKLLGSEIVATSLHSIMSDVALIFKESKHIDYSSLEVPNDFFALDGAFIAFFGMLLEYDKQLVSISVVEVANEVILTVERSDIGSLKALLESRLLWKELVKVLPVSEIYEEEKITKIVVPISSMKGKNADNFRYWLAYNLQGDLGAAKSDTVASMLHDLKNNILGYAAASQNAKLVNSSKEKYSLASQASDHVEQALSMTSALKSLLASTDAKEVAPMSIANFIKSTVSGLWSWVPNTITVKAPLGKSVACIWTSEENLRSIVSNLTRNSVEAMQGHGNLEIDYSVNEIDDSLEFIIVDEGPGFSATELDVLNQGLPILSTKNSGQGIGMLTALLLTKELGGNLSFHNNDRSGCTVRLRIPSSPPLEAKI